MFRIYAALAVLVLILGLAGTAYIYKLKYDNVGQQLEQAVEVNKANTRAAKELREDWAAERQATEKELAATQKRAAAVEQIVKDMKNAPGAQDLAGPFWDELAKRLQPLDSGTAD